MNKYKRDIKQRKYVGKTGERYVEFITWNVACGVKRGDKEARKEPGQPDLDAWFKCADGNEVFFGVEVKSKRSDCCVIDDKVLYNLIRVQDKYSNGREDVIVCFFFRDLQEIHYILLEQLRRGVDLNTDFHWGREIMAPSGGIIRLGALNDIDEQLEKMCDGVSEYTNFYKSRQVNKVFKINPTRLRRYPRGFLDEYNLPYNPKLQSDPDFASFVQYYMEQHHIWESNYITYVFENVHKIKKATIPEGQLHLSS